MSWTIEEKKEAILAFATLMIKLQTLTVQKFASFT
jgi:hypothetical protein